MTLTNPQGTADQNHGEISPHPSKNDYYGGQQVPTRLWRKVELCTRWWECAVAHVLWKTGGFSQN